MFKHIANSLLGAAALFISVASVRAESMFQFGLFAPELQIVDATEDVRGLRIDFVYGENRNVSGVDIGVVNSTTGGFKGFGWAAGANLVKGKTTGVQWSWLYSHSGGTFTGWQSGVLSRVGGADSGGLQSGWVNLAEADFSGVQFGLINKSKEMNGLQLGVINWADRLNGLQIGLVNYAANSDLYKALPFFNWSF
jgi:hypothetical protein